MNIMKRNYLLGDAELVNNPSTRVPVCLCLDVSGSMDGDPIDELNQGVELFYDTIKDDEVALYSADVSVIAFDEDVECVKEFNTLDVDPVPPTLTANGLTYLGEAVNTALDILDSRKDEYKQNGVDYYQPWLVLMTDGKPNGSSAELERAIRRTRDLVGKKKLTIFPIGIGDDADMDVLAELSPNRKPLKLQGLKFREFFAWLSQSVVKTSQSTPGETVSLDVEGIKGWAEL